MGPRLRELTPCGQREPGDGNIPLHHSSRYLQDVCELPKIVGPCNSRVEQYWYDAEKDECFTFHWGE